LSGAQLISLGVIGEYLGRMYEEVKARPLFLVADEVGLGTPRPPSIAQPATVSLDEHGNRLEPRSPAVEAAMAAGSSASAGGGNHSQTPESR